MESRRAWIIIIMRISWFAFLFICACCDAGVQKYILLCSVISNTHTHCANVCLWLASCLRKLRYIKNIKKIKWHTPIVNDFDTAAHHQCELCVSHVTIVATRKWDGRRGVWFGGFVHDLHILHVFTATCIRTMYVSDWLLVNIAARSFSGWMLARCVLCDDGGFWGPQWLQIKRHIHSERDMLRNIFWRSIPIHVCLCVNGHIYV